MDLRNTIQYCSKLLNVHSPVHKKKKQVHPTPAAQMSSQKKKKKSLGTSELKVATCDTAQNPSHDI